MTSGRRTGLVIKNDTKTDEFGLENLSEYWSDGDSVKRPSDASSRLSSIPSALKNRHKRTSLTGKKQAKKNKKKEPRVGKENREICFPKACTTSFDTFLPRSIDE